MRREPAPAGGNMSNIPPWARLGRPVCGAEEPHQEFVCRSPTEERAVRLYRRFDAHSRHGCFQRHPSGDRVVAGQFLCTPCTMEATEPD